MIEVSGLTKRYGDKTAVDDLSFTVRPGRVTGFLGPNGAGKSTTMRLLLRLDRPTSGHALIDGEPYDRIVEPIRRVGALLDGRSAHPGRTGFDHLLCLAASNRIGRSRVREVVDLVGLQDVAGTRVRSFSLGMGQRLGLATALLGDPPVLVLDEPVNGLDPEGVKWIRELLARLAGEGRTVFLSSHLMTEMAVTAEHLIVIGRGRLLADTSTAEFVARHSRSSVRLRSVAPQRLRDALAARGIAVEPAPDGAMLARDATAEDVARIAYDQAILVTELTPSSSSLEDAFMQLTADAVDHRSGRAPELPR